ncbi:MAG: DUF302 domain-containing protein [Gemmatimonadetes bacterium]|nr:DUF302 domain-containing protein [Gemmatimonadota bacterium]
MSTDLQYGYKRTVEGSPDAVEATVREALASEGFGVLTEIDVKETLKNKLDVDFRPYKILGACNPPLAHKALSNETDIGLLLPCNVVVYEGDEPGTTVVAALDAVLQLGVSGRADMEELANEVMTRMRRAIDGL